MKNYKALVPIILVVLFLLSLYVLADGRMSSQKEYDQALFAARDAAAKGINVDADKYYQIALGKKESFELRMEIGKFYSHIGEEGEAVAWAEEIQEMYPTEPAVYEFLMARHLSAENYVSCYDLYELSRRREVRSAYLESVMEEIKYYYFINETNYIEVGLYNGAYCPVRVKEHWGYAGLGGNIVIKAKYKEVGTMILDLAPVVSLEGDAYFIDPQGNRKHVILGIGYVEKVGALVNDVFPVYDGNVWNFYNMNDEYIFGGFQEISSIGNGVAAVKQGDKWALADRAGKMLTEAIYDGFAKDEKDVVFRNNRLFAIEGGKHYLIDCNGKRISEQAFEDARIFADATYAAVKLGGKWGYIDAEGEFVIEPTYEDARSFSNGFAAVMVDGKWGFITADNKLVIQPQFNDAKDFNSKGGVFVGTEDGWQILRLYQYNH